MKFFIPEPKMPTPEEHRQVAEAWLARAQSTLIDQWPVEIAELSIPTELVRIDALAAFGAICDLMDQKPVNQWMRDLAADLDSRMGWKRWFIRLNSRSPKDNPWPFETPATMSGKEAVMLLAGSMRIFDDLNEFRFLPEQPCYVCLREFNPKITPAGEFRCFVKDGALIAVSHYDYLRPWAGPENQGRELRGKIDAWFTERLQPHLHVKDVVFDLFIDHDGSILLIELNPYGRSDPCHFESYAAVEAASSWIEFGKKA